MECGAFCRESLGNEIEPITNAFFAGQHRYILDNAPCHKAQMTRAWANANGVQLFSSPHSLLTCSPTGKHLVAQEGPCRAKGASKFSSSGANFARGVDSADNRRDCSVLGVHESKNRKRDRRWWQLDEVLRYFVAIIGVFQHHHWCFQHRHEKKEKTEIRRKSRSSIGLHKQHIQVSSSHQLRSVVVLGGRVSAPIWPRRP